MTSVTAWFVLIQHNPNEGLKPNRALPLLRPLPRAHSAQPERGIETDKQGSNQGGNAVLIQHNPNEGLKPSFI